MKLRLICAVPHLAVILGVVALSASDLAAQSAGGPVTTFPADTVVAIRTIDLIDSNGAASDKEYRATVDDSVVISGVTVAPVGTPAFLRVMQVQQAGAVRGRAAVSLRLIALEVDGRRVAFETGDATIRSGSQAANATKGGIGGAVVGGILGGLLGGKEGAAKGAAAGAAAGVTAAVVIGQRVHVPAETRLSFTLTQATLIQASADAASTLPESVSQPNQIGTAGERPQSLIGLIELGQTPTQVEAILGQPDNIVKLGPKTIYVYKTLKVTFTDSKVSDRVTVP